MRSGATRPPISTPTSVRVHGRVVSSEIEDGNERDPGPAHRRCPPAGVEVLPPSINASEPMLSVEDGKIVFGLVAIKGSAAGGPRTFSGLEPRAVTSATFTICVSGSI